MVVVVGGGRWWWVVVGGWVGGGGDRPLEAPGGHRGQFPRTDFGLVAGIDSSKKTLTTLSEPLQFALFGEQFSSLRPKLLCK